MGSGSHAVEGGIPMRTTRVVGVLVVVGIVAMAISAYAEAAPGASGQVNLDVKDISVRDAIGVLFKNTGLKYSIAPDVTGNVVELKLKGISFVEALDALTRAAGLTYKLEDGVYVISSKTPAKTGSGPAETQTPGKTQPEAAPAVEAAPEQPQAVQPAEQPVPPQPQEIGAQVVINPPPPEGPVFYGHPAPEYYPPPYGYGYPNVLQFGNVSVISRYPPLILGPGGRIFSPTGVYPPIPGWVSPDAYRFLTNRYVIGPRPGFGY